MTESAAAEILQRWGLAVRVERIRRRMLQTDLAAAVGCNQSTISDIERGATQPSLALSLRIAEVLQVDADELFALGESV